MLQSKEKGEAARVILKACSLGLKETIMSKGLLNAIAESIEIEYDEDVAALIPIFKGNTSNQIMFQRIIHKIIGG